MRRARGRQQPAISTAPPEPLGQQGRWREGCTGAPADGAAPLRLGRIAPRPPSPVSSWEFGATSRCSALSQKQRTSSRTCASLQALRSVRLRAPRLCLLARWWSSSSGCVLPQRGLSCPEALLASLRSSSRYGVAAVFGADAGEACLAWRPLQRVLNRAGASGQWFADRSEPRPGRRDTATPRA